MKLQEEVFFDFLLDDPNDDYTGVVDINVVFKNPNAKASDKPETILDYIESIILDSSKKGYYDYEVLIDLKESLRDEFGGKYAEKYPDFSLEL
jgi:hypothetical protein